MELKFLKTPDGSGVRGQDRSLNLNTETLKTVHQQFSDSLYQFAIEFIQ